MAIRKLYLKNNYSFPYDIIWTNILIIIPGIFLLFTYYYKHNKTKFHFFNNMVLILGIIIVLGSIISTIHHLKHNDRVCCSEQHKGISLADEILAYSSLIILVILIFYYLSVISRNKISCILALLTFILGIITICTFYISRYYANNCIAVRYDVDLSKKYVEINIPSDVKNKKEYILKEIKNIRKMIKFRSEYEFYHSVWHILAGLTGLIGIAVFIQY